MLEGRRQPYVLAVRSNHTLRMLTATGLLQTDPAQLADALPATAWAAHAAGEGSKGPRLYEWARIALPWTVDQGFERWLLIRRSRRMGRTSPTTWSSRRRTPILPNWPVRPACAGPSRSVFSAKGRARARPLRGPLRHGWHRHMTLCMAALAFLAGLSAQLRRVAASKPNERSPRAAAA